MVLLPQPRAGFFILHLPVLLSVAFFPTPVSTTLFQFHILSLLSFLKTHYSSCSDPNLPPPPFFLSQIFILLFFFPSLFALPISFSFRIVLHCQQVLNQGTSPDFFFAAPKCVVLMIPQFLCFACWPPVLHPACVWNVALTSGLEYVWNPYLLTQPWSFSLVREHTTAFTHSHIRQGNVSSTAFSHTFSLGARPFK